MKYAKHRQHISWQRLSLIALCAILSLILFVMLFATAYVHHLLSLVTDNGGDSLNETLSSEQLATLTPSPDDDTPITGPSVDHEDVTQATLPSQSVEQLKTEGIINIMLIGEDRRPGQGRQRSDSMILCSFNTNTNTITMISFLRDIYISNIPGYNRAEKLNAAYAMGGPKTLNQTLATYFGIHVDANVVVDFDGFTGIIDMLGGVDINLTQKEATHLNEKGFSRLTAGTNHLNGAEALAYSRIRKIDMDAMRAQRQRTVLTALINAYKSKSVTEMAILASDILKTGFVQTDMSSDELLGYVRSLFPMLSSSTINSQQIPASGTYQEMNVGKIVDCKVIDLDINRKILKNIFQ